MSIEQLPLELVREITKDISGRDLAFLQLGSRTLRHALVERQWEHVVIEDETVEADPEWKEQNQFEVEELPAADFGSGRFIRIAPRRLKEFVRWYINGQLGFLSGVLRSLSFEPSCGVDRKDKFDGTISGLEKARHGALVDWIVGNILPNIGAIRELELVPRITTSVDTTIQKIFPNAQVWLHLNITRDDQTSDFVHLINCIGLRVSLGNITDPSSKLVEFTSDQLPNSIESFQVNCGHVMNARGQVDTSLASGLMYQLLEPATDLRSLGLYWNIKTQNIDLGWIPDTVEHLQLLDNERGSFSRRNAVEMPNLKSFELETRYARALRRLIMPNLERLTLRNTRLGKVENQMDAVRTLRAASEELPVTTLETQAISYGCILEFCSDSIETLILRDIRGGTTAFTDMTQTFEDFLVKLSSRYPVLKVLFIEFDLLMESDQFRSILGYYIRRKPGLTIYCGFGDADIRNRVLGQDLLAGSMTQVQKFSTHDNRLVNPRLPYVYKFLPHRFY